MTGDDAAMMPQSKDFVEAVLAQARLRPDAVAVAGPRGSLTFAELESLSAGVAVALVNAGVRPGAVVGVCAGQDAVLPALLLGVARTGAAYLPLDLEHPVDRLAYQVSDSGTRVLLAAGAGLGVAAELSARIDGLLVLDNSTIAPAGWAPAWSEGDDLAYLIYTSGSTGRPKGVEVTRHNLAVHLHAIAQTFPMTPSDVMTTLAGISFDITHLGIWGPLSTGGTCVLLDRDTFADGHALADQLAAHGVSILQATPTSLRTLQAAGWRGIDGIRVMSGGEALDATLAGDLLPVVGELWNFYGPTEATIWATAQRVTANGLDPVTIGRALPGYRTLVLDEAGQPVPPGTVGDLWIAGPGVAKGYRGRPELTAEVFVEDASGERRYRTGDLARELGNGELECLGRRDHQVKVRGYRVELGEIEARLRESDLVSDVAVTVAGDGAGAHLVGHVVWSGTADEPALRRFLGDRLPEYMVPHRWTSLSSLPVLPSGKVDRAALPEATEVAADEQADEPETMIEQFVAKTWCEVLKLDGVRRGDSFFGLGGHSFAATLMVGRLKSALGCRVPVRVLFDHPVLADFAAQVDRIAMEQLAAAGDRA